MAEYNVDILVKAKIQQAERALDTLKKKIDDITKNPVIKVGAKGVQDVKTYANALKDLGLKGAAARGGLAALTLQLGKFGGVTTKVTGVTSWLTSTLGTLVAKTTSVAAGWGTLGASIAASGEAFNLTTKAAAGTEQVLGQVLATLGQMPATWGAAAVAAMAFAPQVAKAGTALNNAVGEKATRSIAATVQQFKNLDEQVKFTATSFQDLIKNSTLNQLNAQLKDAQHQIGEYRSNTEEARISAQQLVAVTKQQAIEQRAINDLVRQAKGITQTELQEAKAIKSLATTKKREEFLKKEAKAAQESAEATRRREQALSDEARERTAATIRKRQKALEEETRRTQEAIKANYELGRSQDILADKRANAVLEMARQRRMAGTTMYGPGGAGPATAGFAANVEAAKQVDVQNKAYADGAKKRIEWEKKVNEISTSLQKELNSLRTKHRRQRYQREIKLAEKAAKYIEGLERKAAQRAESLALGVGFPLLFGGGLGSVAGGALGSVVGSQGFGGQIILSAIGQQIDTVVANVAKLGQALNPLTLDLDAVTTAAGLTGTELGKYIQELENSEGKIKAAAEAQKALAAVVGDEGVDALEEFGTATQRLSNAFDRAMSTMAAGVARLITSIPGFLKFTANLERGAVLQRALTSQDPAQAENLRRLEAARVGTGGVDIEKQQSAIAALIRTQRTIEAGGGAQEDMELLNRKLDVAKQQLEVTKAGTDLADIAVYRARQELQAKEHALRITEVMQEDLTDPARNAKFAQLRLQDERERLQLTKDRQAALDKNAKAGQKEADRISQEVALLNIRNNLTQNMLGIDKQIADAKREGRDADAEALERNKILLQGVAKEAELRVRIKDATLLQAEIRKADLATQAEINKLDGEQADRLADQQKNFDETINRLQLELEGLKGISDTEKDNLRFKEIQLDLLSKDVNLTETKKKQIKDLLADIRSATNAMSEQEFVQNNINNLVNTAGQQFTGLFQTLINGTNDWNSALRNVLSSLANALLKFGLTALGGDDGIGLFSILSGTFTGKPKGKALGGQVGAGTSYLVGEKGPELFMPGAKGNIIPNSALGGMGGGNITVNVDAKGSTVEGNGDQANQLGKVIGAAIQQELIKQKKPGGLLA